ncbi:hypothetical protein [Chryseobacterium sp. MDT2-18]|uniref:hypothetical protein n=1 Tax=Chryseobacterium sp. MDT2-18 TaxID=1259136 RepID=UPI0027807292|nr:hypothetical protein [Chryseobacterium sp. MDT2-18]MDQ0478191.1 hypothetical protein [Chryseobacterium sp. MDT2-18]
MKKISTILLITALSGFVFAQKGNAFSKSFDSNNRPADEANADPGSGGADGADPAPIDDYLPLLAIAGAGMALYFGRKKYILTK